MAGTHKYSMDISVNAHADGIGKTNSELLNLENEAKRLDGKKVSLSINLDGKSGKTIDSIVTSISNIEKSLNTLSTRGIESLESGFGSLGKSIDTTTSAVGSLQSALDGVSGKGVDSIQQSAGSATKALEDTASAGGHLQSAIDGINGRGLDGLMESASKAEDMITDLASQMEKLNTTSGFGDNWNNSYGGRYGGMRYTGQGKGISDLVSWIGNGKSSYELTVENAMNKTRNMAVAKSWQPEGGVTGMDAYWALDTATNNSLMSLNALAAGINATAATTGASAKDIYNHAQDFADFGTMVMGLGYTEDVAQTAVMKLGRGLHGTFAALDQYGITKESLTSTGLWNGDENDLDGYMAAVSQYSKGMSDNLMHTPTGQVATLSKSASLGGYALGQIEADLTAGIATWFKDTDSGMREWTKKMGWGADVRDNWGNRVFSKKGEDGNEKSVYVDSEGNVRDDQNKVIESYKSEADAIAALQSQDYSQKKTGFSLSTLIIGADQVISTYKTVKDTVLGFYAEWRDLQRIRQVGLKGIFKGDDYMIGEGGHIVKQAQGIQQDACSAMNEECPANGSSTSGGKGKKKKKKKGRIGKFKDKIGIGKFKDKISNEINKIGQNKNPQYASPIGPLREKRTLNKKHGDKTTIKSGDYDLGKSSKGFGLLDSIDSGRKSHKRSSIIEQLEDNYSMNGAGNIIPESKGAKPRSKEIERARGKVKTSSPTFNSDRNRSKIMSNGQIIVPQLDGPGLQTGTAPERKGSMNYPQGVKTRSKGAKDTVKEAKKQAKYAAKQTKWDKTKPSFGKTDPSKRRRHTLEDVRKNDEAKRVAKRNAYTNQYGGYMKSTLGAVYDTKQLKKKAKKYINAQKKSLSKAWNFGKWSGGFNQRSWSRRASGAVNVMGKSVGALPSQLGWGAIKNQARGTLVGDLGSSISSRFGSMKSSITGSGAWSKLSGFGSSLKGQITGNAGALWGMTHGGQKFSDSKTGQRFSNWKEKGGVRGAIGRGASRIGGGISKVGGGALAGASKGIGAMAGGLGKMTGLIGGISAGFSALLGPIGAIIFGITLITGLLDAMGVDYMGPLQDAFGGFAEAMKPVIQGFGQWLSDVGKKLGPVMTQIGEALAPILQAIGGLLSSGLGALAEALGPVFEWIGGLFSGGGGGDLFGSLADGLGGLGDILGQLGPLAQNLWSAMSQGAEGFGNFLGGIFDGIGMYITHIIEEGANTISSWFNIIATGIQNAITTVSNAFGAAIVAIGTHIGMAMAIVGLGIGTAIMLVGAGVGAALALVGAGIGLQMAAIGAGIGLGIAAIGMGTGLAIIATLGALGAGIAIIGAGIGLAIAAITTGIAMGIAAIGMATSAVIMMMGMAITQGITMVSQGILSAFTGFAATVAAATATAYATLLLFQGQAVSLMKNTATDMVNGFKSNFHGVDAAIDAELRGAYSTLSAWGDRLVAKARQIGADMSSALVNVGMGVNSPGYIWKGVLGEMQGTNKVFAMQGRNLVSSALNVGRNIVKSFNNRSNLEKDLPTFTNVPSPPQVELPVTAEPRLVREVRQNSQAPKGTVNYNFNHYGDLDNEERANKVLKHFAHKLDFENKRAGRTV